MGSHATLCIVDLHVKLVLRLVSKVSTSNVCSVVRSVTGVKEQYYIEPMAMRLFRALGLGRLYYCIHPVIEGFLFLTRAASRRASCPVIFHDANVVLTLR